MPDLEPVSPYAGRPRRPVLRTGAYLSFVGEPGHAWFARAQDANLPRPIAALPALHAAEKLLAAQARTVGRRATRIPADAFVSVASLPPLLPRPAALHALEAPTPAVVSPPAPRNDNALAGASGLRSIARTAVFGVLLVVTIVLAYWSGRMRGYENVIVVPPPWSDHARIG